MAGPTKNSEGGKKMSKNEIPKQDPKQKTHGEFFHDVELDDDARFFVDNYSRANTVPCADLLDNNGKKVMTIQESDFSSLKVEYQKTIRHQETIIRLHKYVEAVSWLITLIISSILLFSKN